MALWGELLMVATAEEGVLVYSTVSDITQLAFLQPDFPRVVTTTPSPSLWPCNPGDPVNPGKDLPLEFLGTFGLGAFVL
ncbi:hypothetical protein APTSU1_000113900 [Apodemus speciosus]|uniref:Uncharacterized protein n=1 Tax=Apodemus speciosus TaxID=105296 RepID=A0ABQ0EFR5_APOSI